MYCRTGITKPHCCLSSLILFQLEIFLTTLTLPSEVKAKGLKASHLQLLTILTVVLNSLIVSALAMFFVGGGLSRHDSLEIKTEESNKLGSLKGSDAQHHFKRMEERVGGKFIIRSSLSQPHHWNKTKQEPSLRFQNQKIVCSSNQFQIIPLCDFPSP